MTTIFIIVKLNRVKYFKRALLEYIFTFRIYCYIFAHIQDLYYLIFTKILHRFTKRQMYNTYALFYTSKRNTQRGRQYTAKKQKGEV